MSLQNTLLPTLFGALLVVACVVFSCPQLRADDEAKSSLSVTTPWARATPGGVKIGAAYLKVTSKSTVHDRLVGAASPRAGRVELHSHIVEEGVMKMRKVDGFDVGADSPLVLAPGGNHIMLFDLKAPLKVGEMLPLTLTFERAGDVSVEAKVAPIGAQGPTVMDHRGSGSEHDGH